MTTANVSRHRRRSLPRALALALAAAPALASAVPIDGDATRHVHIVRFIEPALASFDGALPAAAGASARSESLAATSPIATGARRLDVDAPASVAYLAELAERREARLEAAERVLGRDIEPLFVYDAVLNGVALSLTEAEARAVAALPGVAQVERERVDQLQDEAGTSWVQAPAVWSGAAGVATRGEGVVVGVIDSGINPSHPAFAAVAPLDGYTHANPRGRFFGLCATGLATCNNKLIGIWDFSTGSGDSEPNNGLDLDGHGTHVAGSAVGNPVPLARNFGGAALNYTIRGVAPRANLISYKACEDDACSGSWTLAALNQAVRDGVDVINYSIGGANGDPWSRTDSLAMLDARNAGIVVVVAAGNRGPDAGTVTSPADAPWVLAVANATHGRRFVNRLRLSGGASPPPNGGILEGEGLTGPAGPAPLVRDALHPLCSQGSGDQSLPVTGASNPWSPGRFRGEIVVCDRGVQARVAKSNNVRLAGGSGTVLINTAAEGESTVADEHSLPTTHLGFVAGQQVLQWLSAGAGHQARIDGVVAEVVPSNADVLNASSGRGPSSVLGGVLKPDVAGPGTSIQSASHQGNGDATLSGTSMASPHVAGAAALLRAARPQWRADQIISALMTTARPSVRRTSGGPVVNAHEQGSGMIDVARAVGASLAFNVPAGVFRDSRGSDPAALNLPSLVFDRCAPGCGTLSRTVTDLAGGGAWSVSVEAPAGVAIAPSTSRIALGAGASRTFSIDATVTDPALYGRWLYGALVLVRDGNPAVAETRVPIAVRALPSAVAGPQARTVAADRGFLDFMLAPMGLPLSDARFLGTRLVGVSTTAYALGADPTPADRFDNLSNGVGWQAITVPAAASGRPMRHRIEIELQSPAATQATLIAGNGAGPGSRNTLCESPTRCVLDVEHPGGGGAMAYWAMVWNRSGSGNFTVSHSVLPLAPADAADPARLAVTGPGTTAPAESSALRIGWHDPTWRPGEVRRGAVLVYAAPGELPMASVPFTLTRAPGAAAALALASGVEQAVGLPAGGSHERLFIDVPAGTAELRVTAIAGAGNVDLHLARRDFSAPATPAAAAVPAIAAAPPRAEAARSGTGPGDESLLVADPVPGRWYVTPVNAGAAPTTVRITASLRGTAPPVRPGSYFNPDRPGHGLFLYPAGDVLAGLWYTSGQDGRPTWYYLQGDRPAAGGAWRGQVFRSAWNGRRNHLVAVGDAAVVPTGADAFAFTYSVDGESGSEPYSAFGRRCPSLDGRPVDASGHWFDPSRAGTGYSVQLFPDYEFIAVFGYDGRGVPRYLAAERAGGGAAEASLPLLQVGGYCPLCARTDLVRTRVGTLTRRFGASGLERVGVDAEWVAGLPGRWTSSDAVVPLGGLQGCAP